MPQKKPILPSNQEVIDLLNTSALGKFDQCRIADAMGISNQQLSNQLREKYCFDMNTLLNITQKLSNLSSTDEQKRRERRSNESETAWQNRLAREEKQAINAREVFMDIIFNEMAKKGVKQSDFSKRLDTMCKFMQMSDAIWIIKQPEVLTETPPNLLSKNSELKHLLIAVSVEMVNNTIAELEKVVYGQYANFSDVLNVRLVTSDAKFAYEIIGSMTRKVFLNTNEGFYSLEHPESQFFIDYLSTVQDMPTAWSILASPEARALEVMIREAGEQFSPDLIGYLRQHQVRFEANPQAIAEDVRIWPHLQSILCNEAEMMLDSASVDILKNCVEFFSIRQV